MSERSLDAVGEAVLELVRTRADVRSVVEKLLLASPRGYCAGVDRAVQTVERALDLYGAPVYVRKEIVHNKHVVAELRKRGAVFVEELDETIPEGRRPSSPPTANARPRGRRAPRAADDRRDVPARDQGPIARP